MIFRLRAVELMNRLGTTPKAKGPTMLSSARRPTSNGMYSSGSTSTITSSSLVADYSAPVKNN